MDNDLISKKDLLEEKGISYGQLYRWKRKSLIPEEWFIRKSTFTGQETFFPKEKILSRIDKIINMKEDVSLDDLAEMFSPQLSNILLSDEELLTKKLISRKALEIFNTIHGETKTFSFEKILYISVLEKCLHSGEVAFEEGKGILQTLEEHYKAFEGKNCEIILLRKFGTGISFIITVPNELQIESSAKLVLTVNIPQCIEELKIKLNA